MKKNNPLKKLQLVKKTIAHLNEEQMYAARGGETWTFVFCTETKSVVTYDCPTVNLCVS